MRAKVVIASLLISAMSPAVFAQQPLASWSSIEQARGQKIIVVRKDNHSQHGKMEEVSAESLTVTDHERKIVIPRNNILRLYAQTGRSRKRGALLGLAIGAGGGAIAGAAGTQPCNTCIVSFSRGEGAAVGATAGAAVGTIVGVLVGGKRKQILLYENAGN